VTIGARGPKPGNVDRRDVLGGVLALPVWSRGTLASTSSLMNGVFPSGVASGDPTSNSVVLWTRCVAPDEAQPSTAVIAVEVAEDDGFTRLVFSRRVAVPPHDSGCVKVDVPGLRPGRPYVFRFFSALGASVVGRTMTAPNGPEPLTAAFVSCANYPAGFFHAYRDVASDNSVDVCVHMGDYIYELGRDAYVGMSPTVFSVPERLSRLSPVGELQSYDDYSARYALYRSDPDLQALHAAKPMLCIWDDHEFVNDAWRGGAPGRPENDRSAWIRRRRAARKAWFDWLPVRSFPREVDRIYRGLQWGSSSLFLLDSRLIGRSRPMDYAGALAPYVEASDSRLAERAQAYVASGWNDSRRTVLGSAQEGWLDRGLSASARSPDIWQIIVQSTLFSPLRTPTVAPALASQALSDAARARIKLDARLTSLGSELTWEGGWGGYPAARARLIRSLTNAQGNAIIVGGDYHNAFAYNVFHGHGAGRKVCALHATSSSVTSAGLESRLTGADAGGREAAYRAVDSDLAWCDLTHRGYLKLALGPVRGEAQWITFDRVTEQVTTRRVAAVSPLVPGRSGLQPWAVETPARTV
jgi:alkaline phosphatase D